MVAVGSGISLEAQASAAGPSVGDVETLIADQRRVVKFTLTTPTGVLTVGDGKGFFVVPSILDGHVVVGVAARNVTPSSSGTPTFQIRRNRAGSDVDVLSTRVTIDVNERSSTTGTPAVINASNDDLATDDILFVDADVVGTGAAGFEVEVQVEAP